MTNLLTLIENCDPDNAEMLDEIDARVHCLVTNGDLRRSVGGGFLVLYEGSAFGNAPEYTRSLDAIKAIEPDGWYVEYGSNQFAIAAGLDQTKGWRFSMKTDLAHKPRGMVIGEVCRTEHLARLHAVIQAIEYERKNDESNN